MFLNDYITLCAEVELAVAQVYDHFATQFANEVEFSTFWQLSAEAERYHAATIRIHEATIDADQPVDESMLPLKVDAARELLDELRDTLLDIQARPRSPEQALELAMQIEEEGAEVHGRTQFEFLYPHLRTLFQRLAAEDQAHRKSFERARKVFASAS